MDLIQLRLLIEDKKYSDEDVVKGFWDCYLNCRYDQVDIESALSLVYQQRRGIYNQLSHDFFLVDGFRINVVNEVFQDSDIPTLFWGLMISLKDSKHARVAALKLVIKERPALTEELTLED